MDTSLLFAVVHDLPDGQYLIGLYATEAAAHALATVKQQDDELDRAELDAWERSTGREPWVPSFHERWTVRTLSWGECHIGHSEEAPDTHSHTPSSTGAPP